MVNMINNRKECCKCGHVWYSNLPNGPVMCPRCKRRDWSGLCNSMGMPRKSITVRECGKCGYAWKPRRAGAPPAECPRCKRRDWDIAILIKHACSNCHDRGMRRADGTGCPYCGKIYGS